MFEKKFFSSIVLAASLCTSHVVSAGLISGDFRTESNLPDYRTGQPLVYQNLNQSIDIGYELDSSDFLENPDVWSGGVVWMDYNPSNNILTLDSKDTLDFQTFDAWVMNISFDIVGEYISGFTLLSNSITIPTYTPQLSYTNNSLHISYDARPSYFNFTAGLATLQVETKVADGSSIPEPASLALLGIGLAGLSLTRRRKRA